MLFRSGTNGGGAFKLDSLLDYPLFFAAQNVFEWGQNTKQLEDHFNALAANYDPNTLNQLVTFLDNHDTTRFLNSANANGDTNKLAVALAFLHTARGIPCVYQGTEQAFNGGTDPNNREDMFAGAFEQGPSLGDNFNLTHPQFQLIARLNNFRRLYPALALGSYVNQWNNPGSAGLFAYARRLGAQEIFVALNTAATAQTLPSRSVTYAPGTVLVNLLNPSETISIIAGAQTPSITVPATTAKIFLAQSQVLPLNPVVTNNYPAHAVTNIPTWASVVLQFSQPMEPASAQAAFGISPVVSGTFSWSPARDALTFTPDGAGFSGLTTYTVRLTNSAFSSVSSNALFALYELKFKTAAFTTNSRPALAPFNAAGLALVSGNFQLTCSSMTNWSYQLQRRDSLDSHSDWLNLGVATTGTGAILFFSDAATNATRFYRLQAR